LTNRTYDDVLSAGVWAVFQEGYKKGYGADGDHLKTHEEVKYALEVGFSMITLDCSSHIGKGIYENLEEEYLNKDIDGLIYTSDNIKNIINIYYGAVKHAIDIYNSFIRGTNIDFEMSIDETSFTTSPEAHYFIANELKKAGVELISLAPKFCGEFQKGIDYRGDLKQFEDEFKIHAKIAKMMGYKLSIHSGSDKLAVYPIIYKETGRNVHIKTAGTNWLEALRVIAQKNPSLFREIFKTALVNLAEAKKLYHITENAANIPTIIDSNLLDHDDARQVLHITYGAVLAAHKNEIYATLNEFEEDYYKNLKIHLDKHLFV
ncbi:MAG: tagaturonate epimerase family protein, partial [Oscillospiraceae bacterium]|nr:tagaturonate epimerase family protein [Oscillospiraceae bacterium]